MFGTALKHFLLIILTIFLIHISIKNFLIKRGDHNDDKKIYVEKAEKTKENDKDVDYKEAFSDLLSSPDLDDFFNAKVMDSRNKTTNPFTTEDIPNPPAAVNCKFGENGATFANSSLTGLSDPSHAELEPYSDTPYTEIKHYTGEKVMNGGELMNGVCGFSA